MTKEDVIKDIGRWLDAGADPEVVILRLYAAGWDLVRGPWGAAWNIQRLSAREAEYRLRKEEAA